MELARIFDACQGDRLDEWRVVPGGDVPDTNLLAALVDGGDQSGPALATLPHLHRAVCVPDARVGLGWGMDPEEWRDRRPKGKPDWASPQWSNAEPSVRPPAAPVLRRMQASWQAPAPARSGRPGGVSDGQRRAVVTLAGREVTPGEPGRKSGAEDRGRAGERVAGFPRRIARLALPPSAAQGAAERLEGPPTTAGARGRRGGAQARAP
jgi:hypothetical protein